MLYAVYHCVPEEVVQNLLDCGADIEAQDSKGNTSLLLCCESTPYSFYYRYPFKRDRLYLIDLLLQNGADLEARDNDGNTPLINAVIKDNPDILQIFIKSGASLEAMSNKNQTSLILASDKNKVKIAHDLLEGGVSVDSRDESGMTPLMYASLRGNLAIMKMLLQYGADLNAETWDDVTFSTNSKNESNDKLADLTNQLFGPKTVIPKKSTALTFAQLFGGRGALKILLENGAIDDSEMKKVLEDLKSNWYKI